MTTYYLQEGTTDSARRAYKKGEILTLPDKRIFLDANVHGPEKAPNKVIKKIKAESWFAAREQVVFFN